MKQLLTIIVLAAILWTGFSYLNQQFNASTVRQVSANPDLTIDGQPVTAVYAFTNARVIDGDSVRVSDANSGDLDLRLAAIDAPELQQAFGADAKQHLQQLLGNREIIAWEVGTDRYSRRLVFLFFEKPDGNLFEINAQMIADGFAWHYGQHSSNQILRSMEEQARSSRLGLWNDPGALPPWEFRQQ